MKLTKSIVTIRVLLYIGIFLALAFLAEKLYFRLDFSADQRYTLSKSTKDILNELKDQVTVTAYFSDDLPPDQEKTRVDLKDMLAEYASYAGDNLVYEFVSPKDDEEKQKAQQAGVIPLEIPTREDDEIKVQLGFMGAIIKMGGQSEPIPRIADATGMEYSISSRIKKLTVKEKSKVGVIVGHGEAKPAQLAQAQQLLSIQYQLDTVDLSVPNAWANFKTMLMLKPQQPFPPNHLDQLDQFLASGGRLLLALDAVKADLNQQGPWTTLNTGIENWLSNKGVKVEQAFLTDVQCAQISIQQQQQTPFGPMMVNRPVSFPYFPFINHFVDHPITLGLEQMLLQFPSPITLENADSTVRAGVLLTASDKSGKIPAPTFFNPDKQWTEGDFPLSNQAVAVWLEGKLHGTENESKMVVVGDGDFPLTIGQQQNLPDNINFLVNAIDWLTDDTGLIALRTKGVAVRPLDEKLETGERTTIKIINFLLPILIVFGYAVMRWQVRRMKRLKWEAQDFS